MYICVWVVFYIIFFLFEIKNIYSQQKHKKRREDKNVNQIGLEQGLYKSVFRKTDADLAILLLADPLLPMAASRKLVYKSYILDQ